MHDTTGMKEQRLLKRISNEIAGPARLARKSLRMRHVELGKLSGVHYQKIRRWEQGEAKLSFEEIHRVTGALDAAFLPQYFGLTKEEIDQRSSDEISALRNVMDQKLAEALEAQAPGPHADNTRTIFKKLRQDYALTQAEVAKEWGKSQSMVASYEGGHSELLPDDLNALEAALLRLIGKRKPQMPSGSLTNWAKALLKRFQGTFHSVPPWP